MPSAASCGPSGSLPGRLRAANGGMVSGFFDVFAWREPGQVGFYEAKIGPDRIKPAQLRFVELALRLHRLEEFMIVEVTGPLSRSAPAREPGKAADRNVGRPVAGQPSRVARTLCGGPGRTCCRRWAALPGQMSRKRARCSATCPLPSKHAADSTSLDELQAPGGRQHGHRSRQARRSRTADTLLRPETLTDWSACRYSSSLP